MQRIDFSHLHSIILYSFKEYEYGDLHDLFPDIPEITFSTGCFLSKDRETTLNVEILRIWNSLSYGKFPSHRFPKLKMLIFEGEIHWTNFENIANDCPLLKIVEFCNCDDSVLPWCVENLLKNIDEVVCIDNSEIYWFDPYVNVQRFLVSTSRNITTCTFQHLTWLSLSYELTDISIQTNTLKRVFLSDHLTRDQGDYLSFHSLTTIPNVLIRKGTIRFHYYSNLS